jgi:predicted anti-sigma-YlaC factor YlaD
MTCDQIQESLSQFIDHELDHEAMAGSFAHLGTCDACRAFFQSALRIRSEIVTAPALRVPDGLDARVQRLWKRRDVSPARRIRFADVWRMRFTVPTPAAAAVILLVVTLMVSTLVMFDRGHSVRETAAESEYTLTLPTVEIQGTYPEAQKSVQ